jgi:hypothetical protein
MTSTMTLAELDRAMEAYRQALEEKPGEQTHAVFMAIKCFEMGRRERNECIGCRESSERKD